MWVIESFTGCLPITGQGDEGKMLEHLKVRLPLTGRSGPLVVEIEYRVAQANARAFHNLMQDIQLIRQRNGAYGWSIARDIADPEFWTERYHCPTWLDYLRQRNRSTQSERAGRAGGGISYRVRSDTHPAHARAPVRISVAELVARSEKTHHRVLQLILLVTRHELLLPA
ncbi:hypothetical protein ACVWWI_006617 [Bradyrhizobium sp. USDA 3686]|nr:hypothetical protein [Bradyrhizobium canariense]